MNSTMWQSSTLDTISQGLSATMNTTSDLFESSTTKNSTLPLSSIEITTVGPSQLPSFVIPVSVVTSLLFVIGVISLYVCWRIKNRRRPLPLPNPYPEKELLVRFQSNSVENDNYDNDDDDDDSRILIQPPPSQRELELIQSDPANKEPIYKNEPISQEDDSSPIYENCPVYLSID